MAAYTLLTTSALNKLQQAQTTGKSVKLSSFAVGDGNGKPVSPSAGQTDLVNPVYSAALNRLAFDEATGYIYARCPIPADSGGYTIREIGVFDSDGDLFAVGKTRQIEKPAVGDSDIAEVVIDIVTDISNADLVELSVDPSVVLATLADVDERGLPAGGLTNQVLKKSNNSDYQTEWFDPAQGLKVTVLPTLETIELTASQSIVTFNIVSTAGVAIYIDGTRYFNFTIDNPTTITLNDSFAAGSRLVAIQNEPAGIISADAIAVKQSSELFPQVKDVQDVIDHLGDASLRQVGEAQGELQAVGAFSGPQGSQHYWHSGNFKPDNYVLFDELTEFGYGWLQTEDVTAARELLNLGSASTRDVGTAAGNLLEMTSQGLGGLGYGGDLQQVNISDFNTETTFWPRYHGNIGANRPATVGVLMPLMRNGYGAQVDFGFDGDLFVRGAKDNVFGNWNTYWHSGNLTPDDYVSFDQLTDFGYSLTQSDDAADARNRLNLGSVATLDVGESAGNVMEVGAGGLLKIGTNIGSFSAPFTTQFLASAEGNRPTNGSSQYYYGFSVAGSESAAATVAMRDDFYWRFGGEEEPYVKVWDVHNLPENNLGLLDKSQTWTGHNEFIYNNSSSNVGTVAFVNANSTAAFQSFKSATGTSGTTYGATRKSSDNGIAHYSAQSYEIYTFGERAVLIGDATMTVSRNTVVNGSLSAGKITSSGNIAAGTINSGNITSSGSVSASAIIGTSYVRSDPKLKENKEKPPITREQLDSISCYYFDWKCSEEVPEEQRGQHDIGVMADEVERVFPECVSKQNGIKIVDYAKFATCFVLADYRLRRTEQNHEQRGKEE